VATLIDQSLVASYIVLKMNRWGNIRSEVYYVEYHIDGEVNFMADMMIRSAFIVRRMAMVPDYGNSTSTRCRNERVSPILVSLPKVT
jgi:hypothetical protein